MTTSIAPSLASLRRFPSLGALERLAPAGLELLAPRWLHRVGEAAVDLPLRRDLLLVLPVADGQPGQIRGAQRRRLGNLRPHRGNAQQVRLELHRTVARGRAAIHA